MAEWLRRQIRTPFDYLFPFGSAGSNPAGVVSFSTLVLNQFTWVRHGRAHMHITPTVGFAQRKAPQ